MRFTNLLLSGILVVATVANPGDGNDSRALNGGTPCSEPAVEFKKSVLVDFDGFDDDYKDKTRIDWQALEILFIDAYNSLSAVLCDDLFRRVEHVTIESDENDSKLIKRGGDVYSLRFTVQGTCRGCDPDDMTLFSPPDIFSRELEGGGSHRLQDAIIDGDGTVTGVSRNLSSKSSKKSKSSKSCKSSKKSKSSSKGSSSGKGKGKGDDCDNDDGDDDDGDDEDSGDVEICECKSRNPEYRPPTEDEFRLVYDSRIRDAKDGYIPPRRGGVSVDYVLKVTETYEVEPCSDVVEEFETLVAIEFYGVHREVTNVERTILEENIVYVYNGLQSHRCDEPLFRKATSAEFEVRADPSERKIFIYIFKVEGTCRGEGCSDDIKLFDSDDGESSRRLHFEAGDGGWGHAEPESGCTCPVFSTESGAPTTDDFEARFFVVVQDLKAQGRLPNVDASGEVTELPFPETTTSAPTTEDEFSELPTASPTRGYETDVPGETDSPSISPAPSEPDAPDESPAPTATNGTLAPATVPPDTISPQPSDAQGETDSPTKSRDVITASPTETPSPIPDGNNTTPAPFEDVTPGTPAPSPKSGNTTRALADEEEDMADEEEDMGDFDLFTAESN